MNRLLRKKPYLCVSLSLLTLSFCSCSEQKAPLETKPPEQSADATSALTAVDPERNKVKNLAAAQMGQFQYADAVKTLRPLAEREEALEEDRIDLAIALLNRREGEDLNESSELLEQVIKDTPDNERALYTRALLLFNEGKMDRAKELFSRTSELDPQDAYAAFYVGQCEASQGNHARAIEWFVKAKQIDPYLRSAYYGEFQALQRLKERDAARAVFNEFQRLGDNPRSRLAELKYTRMGPKAEVGTADYEAKPAPLPEGAIFSDLTPLNISNGSIDWLATFDDQHPPSVATADYNNDGHLDLVFCRATQNGLPLLLRNDGNSFKVEIAVLWLQTTNVNATLWGDYDNDGLIDVYLCREGANQLWRQTEEGWIDTTDPSGASGGDYDTVDGLCYDIDHDGDLDYLLVNSDGPRELLNNDRDGSFREVASDLGLAGVGGGSKRVVVADFDHDDDADLLFINNQSPHEALLNDRLWNYSPAPGLEELSAAQITAAVGVDADVDGQTEIYTAGANGVLRWMPNEKGVWKSEELSKKPSQQLIAYDFNGDASLELFARHADGWQLIDLSRNESIVEQKTEGVTGDLGLLITSQGPELVAPSAGSAPLCWKAGPGRHPFVLIDLAGRIDKAAEMRSNASGIGVKGVARIGKRWAPIPEGKPSSAAGQGRQPYAIGTAGAEKLDFIRLLWPDGVSQTELDLKPGELHTIAENQRQAGSCPLIFVWDGESFTFVADVLGAGGIGFNLGRGEYYPPRPEENFLLPHGILKPKNDRLLVKLGEPMEEVCYFDAVRLVAYDLPPDWSMTLDERFGGLGPAPTGKPVFYQTLMSPKRATNDHGEDVTTAVNHSDGNPAPLRRADRRFTGLCETHSVTLEFDQPIDALAAPTLLFNGWVEYAYSQSAFAAWQAGEEFIEPTIEAQNPNGKWMVVAERFGYPAGTPREGSVPLSKENLQTGVKRLRITTNMQIYWDRLALIDATPCPDAVQSKGQLLVAEVLDVGFAERILYDHRRPIFDYDNRPPLGDTRHPAGYYTAFGEATELVDSIDDALAIIGPGEELQLEFAAPFTGPPSAGWTRHWVLECNGWCKDADLFTRDSGTVGPLPYRDEASRDEITRREALHTEYNTRFRSGY